MGGLFKRASTALEVLYEIILLLLRTKCPSIYHLQFIIYNSKSGLLIKLTFPSLQILFVNLYRKDQKEYEEED